MKNILSILLVEDDELVREAIRLLVRVDTILTKHIRTGIVVALGQYRRRRYRLRWKESSERN